MSKRNLTPMEIIYEFYKVKKYPVLLKFRYRYQGMSYVAEVYEERSALYPHVAFENSYIVFVLAVHSFEMFVHFFKTSPYMLKNMYSTDENLRLMAAAIYPTLT